MIKSFWSKVFGKKEEVVKPKKYKKLTVSEKYHIVCAKKHTKITNRDLALVYGCNPKTIASVLRKANEMGV